MVENIWFDFIKQHNTQTKIFKKPIPIPVKTRRLLVNSPQLIAAMELHDGTHDYILPVTVTFSTGFAVDELVKLTSLAESTEMRMAQKGRYWHGDYWPVGVMGNGDLYLLDIETGGVFWRSHEEESLQKQWENYGEFFGELLDGYVKRLRGDKKKFSRFFGLENFHPSSNW